MSVNTGSDFDYTPYHRSAKPGVNAKRRLKGIRKKQMDPEIEKSDILPSEFENPKIEIQNTLKTITSGLKVNIKKINLILSDPGNKEKHGEYFDYINEFMSRPRVGAHILLGGDLYEITKLPINPGGPVMVRKKDYTSKDIHQERPMSYEYVRDHMIPDAQATDIITSQILSFSGGGVDDGVYFVDKEWRMHPDMDSVNRANMDIMDIRYPFKLKNLE